MTTLFSYCIRTDNGSAPNPFWGLCTLAICKPRIRRSAEVGDWVVGTGSAGSPIGNISNKVVYAMRVTQKMTMEEYDEFTRSKLRRKIPLRGSPDLRRCMGDSIYDYSVHQDANFYPQIRPSVHDEWHQKTDLSGDYVLLSDHFFYFGDRPVTLPEELLGIVKKGRAHKSQGNAQYVDRFISWIENLGYSPATVVGNPQKWLLLNTKIEREDCAPCHRQKAETDLEKFDSPRPNRC